MTWDLESQSSTAREGVFRHGQDVNFGCFGCRQREHHDGADCFRQGRRELRLRQRRCSHSHTSARWLLALQSVSTFESPNPKGNFETGFLRRRNPSNAHQSYLSVRPTCRAATALQPQPQVRHEASGAAVACAIACPQIVTWKVRHADRWRTWERLRTSATPRTPTPWSG